ncbi:polyprenol monophosphomannose synthase [Acidianus sp. RZ1]|uniref:polyprenol monophosphomannose synthase n=1 Tax=Acidianus sp. RZ1 TaxID=1540082 RepID=UPI001491AC1F|nr:polyprenol monophosphomannose synthase [Acidianus sp. RZ1]NON62016.1 polyprenol monophosphomannose synthase [Acidianus sp. RZ1]
MIYIVIPTYKEKENITRLVKVINSTIDATVLIVDDNSQDGTLEALNSLGFSNLVVVERKTERGLGSAIRSGIKTALDKGAEYVITMDADFSHDPLYLPYFLDKRKEGYDLVIGSRYIKGGKIENWPLKRRIISKGANFLVKFFLKSPLHDNTSNYRLYSKRALEEVIKCDNANGFEFQICAIYSIIKAKLKIGEIPIVFRDRENGNSKLTTKEMYTWFKYLLKLYSSS